MKLSVLLMHWVVLVRPRSSLHSSQPFSHAGKLGRPLRHLHTFFAFSRVQIPLGWQSRSQGILQVNLPGLSLRTHCWLSFWQFLGQMSQSPYLVQVPRPATVQISYQADSGVHAEGWAGGRIKERIISICVEFWEAWRPTLHKLILRLTNAWFHQHDDKCSKDVRE